MEYRKVCKFKYKNENYQLLLDDSNKLFYLKINANGNYKYVTIEEYIELSSIFLRPYNIMNAEGKKVKIVPKIIAGGAALMLTTSLIGGISNFINDYVKPDLQSPAYYETYEPHIETSLSFEVEDQNTSLNEDTYFKSDMYNTTYVYDMDYLDNIMPAFKPTKQDLIDAVNSNPTISDHLRPYLYDYIERITSRYPDIEYRILYTNLKTIQFQELTRDELTVKTMSSESWACYDNLKNAIYLLKGNEYEFGSWKYQTLFHETSHAARTSWTNAGGYDIRVQSWGPNLNLALVNEMLNSVFTVSLYEDDLIENGQKDIAYQLQSNYLLVILGSLNNYSLSDYMNHSASRLAIAMDEAHGDTNYASVILTLINTQYEDFHSSRIEIPQEEYYPIYDYLSDLYFTSHIHDGMSYEEAKAVCDKMVSIIMFDVPEEYNIDVNRFYQNLDEYCEQIGISPYAR